MIWIPVFLCEDVGDVGGSGGMMDGNFIIYNGFAYSVFVDLKMAKVFVVLLWDHRTQAMLPLNN